MSNKSSGTPLRHEPPNPLDVARSRFRIDEEKSAAREIQKQAVVENGWVTLTGEVTWGFQRQSAEDAIRFQSGVKGVSNNITLKPTVKATEVKNVIEKALKRNAEIDAARINVTADGGKVTLAGSVSSWDERQEASSAAWSTPGVTSVENDLAVSY